jgi:hypothetical protein
MEMNGTLLKRIIPQVLAWGGLLALTGALAVAQAATSDSGQVAGQAAAQAAGQRTDGQIEMDVVHALDGSRALKSDLITAATIEGEVTLSGTVSSEASSELAESIAGRVAGVTKVHNNLTVGNPQAAQAPMKRDPGAQQMADSQGDEAMAPIAPPPPGADGPMAAPGSPAAQQPYPPAQAHAPDPPASNESPYPPGQAGQAGQAPGQADGGQAPYPQARPQYGAPQPPYPLANPRIYRNPQSQAYAAPKGPVTIPQGTLLQLRTSEGLTSKRAKDGELVQFTVIRDVAVGGVLALPKGATVHGVVTEVKKAGDLGGSPELALKLTSLDLGGQSYALDSDQFKVKGPNKAGQTVGSAVGGGIIGTIIGCAVGRGAGCAIGAGAGLAAGTAASAASPGPGVWIPAEALVTFHLNAPVTVNPVDAQEAARLAQGLYNGGPSLYRRGYYPYGSPYVAAGYPGYPYGYPSVFYRPYYLSGGYYYWR